MKKSSAESANGVAVRSRAKKLLSGGKNRSLLRKIVRDRWLYLLIAPAVVYLFIFNYIPMYGVIIAFKDYNSIQGIWGSPWAEPFYQHFVSFVTYSDFWLILRNTFFTSFWSIIVSAPTPIILALMINEVHSKSFRKVIQTISYAPYFVSVVVVVGMCENFTNLENCIVNKFLTAFGMDKISYLSDESWFLPVYLISSLWQGLGWWAIIYIGTLANCDPDLHEAAKIDGANRFQRIIHINLPAIIPIATISFILSVGNLMSVGFEKIYLMQSDLNLPRTEVISTYVYKRTFGAKGFKPYSYGAAVGLFNTAVNLILLFFANFVSKKVGGETVV